MDALTHTMGWPWLIQVSTKAPAQQGRGIKYNKRFLARDTDRARSLTNCCHWKNRLDLRKSGSSIVNQTRVGEWEIKGNFINIFCPPPPFSTPVSWQRCRALGMGSSHLLHIYSLCCSSFLRGDSSPHPLLWHGVPQQETVLMDMSNLSSSNDYIAK